MGAVFHKRVDAFDRPETRSYFNVDSLAVQPIVKKARRIHHMHKQK